MEIKTWKEWWEERSSISDPMARDGYTGLTSEERHALTDYVLERLELDPDNRFLEIGCGSGWFLHQIEPRVSQVTGTDISAGMISHYSGQATLIHCEALDIAFENESFDRILMFSVSHYFPDLEYFRKVLEKIHMLLAPNGIAFIGDVNLYQSQMAAYKSYNVGDIVKILDDLQFSFSVMAQPKNKRDYHRPFGLRHDLILRKD